MNIEELFSGIGVVIDDKVFAKDEQNPDHILSIVDLLENTYHFPLVKYSDLPSNEKLAMMGNISFLLLDWEFDTREEVFGEGGLDVSIGNRFKDANEKRVIEIVKEVSQNSLVPIFIFSNQSGETIIKALDRSDVDTTKTQIYVESKSALVGEGQLFAKIGLWVDAHSGVYVAKAWDNAFNKAKNQFFATMCNNTSHWPKAIFDSAVEDHVEAGEELTQSVSQNILSRMLPIDISQEQIDKDTEIPGKDEILGIMQGQFFIEKKCDTSIVGDFYKCKDKYFLNIRPTCDCVGREANSGVVYLLECSKMSSGQIKSYQGHLIESPDCAMVGPLYNGKFYRVRFKELYVVQENECRDKKVGRVLPPLITHIAERYGLYIQRQALPRIPKEILPDGGGQQDDVTEVADEENQKPGCLTAIINAICCRKK